MGWKDYPYWLKGGIVSLFLVIILTITLFIINPSCNGECWFPLWNLVWILPSAIISAPLSAITGYDLWDEFLNFGGGYIGRILLPILFYFLVGAFIGWIIGKIKNKRSESTEPNLSEEEVKLANFPIWLKLLLFLILALFIVALIINYLRVDDSKPGYSIQHGNVYYVDYSNSLWSPCKSCKPELVIGADSKTFETIPQIENEPRGWGAVDYAKDKNHVYFKGKMVFGDPVSSGPDPTSFSVFNITYTGTYEDGHNETVLIWTSYAKDKNVVYVAGRLMEGADINTFTVIDQSHARDKNNYYFGDTVEGGYDVSSTVNFNVTGYNSDVEPNWTPPYPSKSVIDGMDSPPNEIPNRI